MRQCRHVSVCNYFEEEVDQSKEGWKEAYCSGMCDVSLSEDCHFRLMGENFGTEPVKCRLLTSIIRSARALESSFETILSSMKTSTCHRNTKNQSSWRTDKKTRKARAKITILRQRSVSTIRSASCTDDRVRGMVLTLSNLDRQSPKQGTTTTTLHRRPSRHTCLLLGLLEVREERV